jgi:hypothetical protein
VPRDDLESEHLALQMGYSLFTFQGMCQGSHEGKNHFFETVVIGTLSLPLKPIMQHFQLPVDK